MRVFEELTIDDLIEKAKERIPDLDEVLVRDAYALAEEAHAGQVRGGHPYIFHPLEVTYLMLRLNPDVEAVLASLLHDVPNHKPQRLIEIEKKFGSEVRSVVSDSMKLGLMQINNYQNQVETFRRMVLAMAKNLRVVFIRLSDRLHNMMTLDSRPEDFRLRMAQETRDIYAPIAARLGIYSFKGELEDLAFKYLEPKEYESLMKEIERYGEMHEGSVEKAIKDLDRFLHKQGVEAKVSGRMKHTYSIYSKMKRKGFDSIESIYDIYALRVVLPDKGDDISHLYSILGLVHQRWTPLPHRFKDYVAVPKANGYRSLHTAVMGLVKDSSQPVEIQIRTESMHEEARYGIASHWWYKEGGGDLSKKISPDEFQRTVGQYRVFNKLNKILQEDVGLRHKVEVLIRDWDSMDRKEISAIETDLFVKGFSTEDFEILKKSRSQRSLMTRHKYFQNQLEWLDGLAEVGNSDNVKMDLFSDRIFVLTPRGEVKDLPRGATPIDFAYAVHTDLGHKCYQVKVDGRIAPLDYELKNGQVVEILTRKEPNPNRYWLSFVKTNAAANKIKNWFRGFDKDKNVKEGRELLNRHLKRVGKPILDPKLSLLKNYDGKKMTLAEREGVLELLGNGTLTVGVVIKKIFPESELVKTKDVPDNSDFSGEVIDVQKIEKLIMVGKYDDLPVVLSACCKPKYGDSVVGYVTRGKQIRVHKASCGNLQGFDDSRVVSVGWKSKVKQHSYQAELHIRAKDRNGLLGDVTSVISDLGCNIAGLALERDHTDIVGRISLEVGGYDELTKILDRIESVMGVKEVSVE
ncbi:MAG: GTP diphosphokinase [uncultured bacterium]|nr:MAG: GTP diphosphokinase [uncultured bacterium]